MTLDKKLIDKLIKVTSSASIACHKYIGKNDKVVADKAATDAMRKNLNILNIDGKVVIGEGELDKAPMLYIGEKLGTGNGPNIDIAVDPLEGTNFAAKNLPGALSVIAIALKGNLFNAPETYMDKLAVGKDVPNDATDLDFSIEKNIKNIADSKNKDLKEITVCLLDRPRHYEIIEKLKNLNVNLKLLTDGDVSGALFVTDNKYNTDLFIGIGGGPEGVLAAAALKCLDCQMQTRLKFYNDKEIQRVKKMGIKDLNFKYNINDMVKGDVIFCATGVTDGDLVKGIKQHGDYFESETFVLHESSKTRKIIKNKMKK